MHFSIFQDTILLSINVSIFLYLPYNQFDIQRELKIPLSSPIFVNFFLLPILFICSFHVATFLSNLIGTHIWNTSNNPPLLGTGPFLLYFFSSLYFWNLHFTLQVFCQNQSGSVFFCNRNLFLWKCPGWIDYEYYVHNNYQNTMLTIAFHWIQGNIV